MMGALLRVFNWGSKVDAGSPFTLSNLDDLSDLADALRQALGW
ncbi:hypothetical protein [Alicyclobacillus dauci]|uniref:Uncharacterized protein n=1 Tax=Alicyclobacillus dauci TaxID=1475485 RepID=A0ABY6Z9S5_9BACL|nr:hypothetical protein [Alicyclobacillus dauci]WAH39493.1 hypothetical protein NZD86_24300 [Alicyclobacillus dauci]WAH39553.1 hypothetical protein NZD86_24000 [Alicyclobacillus dauci]